jgi:hypothetical protein
MSIRIRIYRIMRRQGARPGSLNIDGEAFEEVEEAFGILLGLILLLQFLILVTVVIKLMREKSGKKFQLVGRLLAHSVGLHCICTLILL